METISEKLDYINKEIKNTNVNLMGDFNTHLKNAKEIKIKYYHSTRLKLKDIDSKILLKHNFQKEIISLAEILEKKVVINKIINTKNIRLEKHKFAPELNKVKFNKTIFEAPNVVSIQDMVSTMQKIQDHKAVNLSTFLTRKNISYLNNILILK